MSGTEYSAADYETLQASGREIAGNRERATVDEVTVGEGTAWLSLSFDWKRETATLEYDLDREREVLKLKSLAGSLGYDFDHLPYLEGETIPVVYLDGQWVPAATLPDVEANVLAGDGGASGGPGLLARTYGSIGRRVENATQEELIVAAVVLKKLLIALAIVYVLVNV